MTEQHTCEDCGLPLVRKNERSPWPVRCADCKRKRHAASRRERRAGGQPEKRGEPSAVASPATPGWFEIRFTPDEADPAGPNDAQHDACRQAAHRAALDQGLAPRGSWPTARLLRVEVADGQAAYVYGLAVRS